MKVTKNFYLHELVDKTTYERFGDFSQRFLDKDTVNVLQFFRDRYGSTTVNNWRQGGNFQYRGFTPPNCTIGGLFSQHKYGRAFDINCKNATPDEIREDILKNEYDFILQGLTRIEDGEFAPTWMHFDCAWTGDSKIHIVKP